MNQNIEGVTSVNTVSENFYSQVRTRSVVEPDFIYDKKYKLNSVDPKLEMDFSRILNKPFFIKNIVWTAATTQYYVLDAIRLPLDLFNNELAKVPFESSVLYRAKISLLLQVSGTPMHSGCVIAAAMPIGFSSAAPPAIKPYSVNSYMAAPHVFLNANEQTSTRLRVPFYINSPLDKTDLDGTTFSPNFSGANYAEAVLMVLNPLGVPTSGTNSVTISVHAVFDDVEFYAPHNDVNYVPIPALPILEAQGLIEDLQKAGSKAIDGVFTTARKLSGDILDALRAGVRRFTGLHSPNFPYLQSKNYVQSRNVLNVVDEPVRFDKMDNFGEYDRVCKDFIFETSQDEMDLKYLGSKPQFIGQFVVKATDGVGTLCFARPISPQMNFTSTTYTNAYGESIPTLQTTDIQGILALMHRYWRGSIKIHIQSVMSNFNYCKLAVARDYSVRTLGLRSYPTFDSISNLMTEFVEFSAGGQIQTIELPYVSALPQLPTTRDLRLNAAQHGMYYIYLNQPLVSNGTVPTSVAFNVYISLGDDFEWFGYSTDVNLYTPQIDVNVPPTKRSGIEPELIEFEAQASVSVPVSTQEDLTAEPVDSHYPVYDFRPVVSIRDHTRRFYKVARSALNAADLAQLNGLVTLNVSSLIGQSGVVSSPVYGSTLDVLSALYLGYAGGARFKIVVTGQSVSSAWYIPPTTLAASSGTDFAPIAAIPIVRSTAPANAITKSTAQYQNLVNSTASLDPAFSSQAPSLERANYAVAGTHGMYNSAGGNIPYIADSTSLLEFEIPNMSPYKFVGDVTKLSTVAAPILARTATTDLGSIVLHVPPTAVVGGAELGINVAIYASHDDVGRMGYQVAVPSVILPGFLAPKSTGVGNATYALGSVNTPVGIAPFGTELAIPQTNDVLKYNYYAKTV